MEPLQYETSGAVHAPNAMPSERFRRREAVSRPLGPTVASASDDATSGTFHGVPMTARVAAAMEAYSFTGAFASLFAFVAGALAHRGVVEDAPVCRPIAALAIIASVTVLVAMRIRLLSVMEEVCIAHGADEHEAKSRSRRALDALVPGRGRRAAGHGRDAV
jgi:hypothetical protein